MEYNNKLNDMGKKGGVDKATLETAVVLMAPFAPHVSEELWEELGHTGSVFEAGWPTYDEDKMKDDELTIPVQVNGKTRATIVIAADEAKDDVLAKAKAAVESKISGTIRKEIYVPGKIVNIVAK